MKLFNKAVVPGRAVRVLILLVAVDLALTVIYLWTYEGSSRYLAEAFHLDHERNIPSTWSALQLLFAGLTVFACIPVDARARLVRGLLPRRYLWLAIGSLLALMGADEYFTYHENLRSIIFDLGMMSPGETTIAGYAWPWTVYGVAFVLLVGVPLAVLTWQAFARNRRLYYLLLFAGALFVTGAIGLENLRVYSIHYHGSAAANAMVTLEETFEMVAVSLVAYVFMCFRTGLLLKADAARGSTESSMAAPMLARR